MQELQTSAMQNIVSMRCEALNLTGSVVRVPSDYVMDDLKNFGNWICCEGHCY